MFNTLLFQKPSQRAVVTKEHVPAWLEKRLEMAADLAQLEAALRLGSAGHFTTAEGTIWNRAPKPTGRCLSS